MKAGADVVVLDGMQGGTAATQEVFIEHVGMPTLACIRPAVQALQDLGMHRKVQLIVSGGIRNGADVAKALALGADAVSIGTAALVALGDNDPHWEDEYHELGTTAGAYDDWHEGRDPAGITTQDPELMKRARSGRRPAGGWRTISKVMTLEAQTIARACGKSHVHNLEPEDLVALTIEAAAMARRAAGRHRLDTGQERLLSDSASGSRERARTRGETTMATDLAEFAKSERHQVFPDLLHRPVRRQRAKLVPAQAIADMQKDGAGFAGFATWLDMTPAASRHARGARSGQPDPAALEAGGRLGRRRPA